MWRWEAITRWLDNPLFGAEIGVKEGRFISYLLKRYPDLKMYAVDPWETQAKGNEDYTEWNFQKIYKEYRRLTEPVYDRVIEIREYSEMASEKVPDHFLDFVFIDAQHDYKSVKRDIELWTPKVIEGGLLCGHDYVSKPKFQGVVDAVDEIGADMFGPNDIWGKRL